MNDDEAFAIGTLALRVAELAGENERLNRTKRCNPCLHGHHDECTGGCESICCALAEAEAEVERLRAVLGSCGGFLAGCRDDCSLSEWADSRAHRLCLDIYDALGDGA